jgi:MFS transporter, PAT family, beta-lactamase induction signal transducer AmpG
VTGEPARKPSFWDAFSNPRLALMIGIGFSCGLPNPLTGSTLTAWLETEHVDLAMIGVSSFFALPYNFKFLWAPLLDRFRLPFFGRRKGWMLVSQLLLMASLVALGSVDPRAELWWIGVFAIATTFFSASQDIVCDAYRTDLLPPEQRASGAAIFVAGFRGAMIVASAVALILAEPLGWNGVYWLMAGLISVGIVTTLIAPAPPTETTAPRTLKQAVVDPLVEYFKRKGPGVAIAFLGIIALYKVGDVVAGHLLNPFLLRIGFTTAEVGAVGKGLGLGATIGGVLLGGGLVARWGLKRALIVFGFAQAIGNLAYIAVALAGKNYTVMTAAIGVDNFMNGLGTSAFVALLTTLCNKRFTAFQYALFSSLGTVAGRLLGGASGWLAEAVGWPAFFSISLVLALPAIAILAFVQIEEAEIAAPPEPKKF